MTGSAPHARSNARNASHARLDARMRASLVSVGATGGAMAIAAVVPFGPRAAASVGFGAALAAANLWTLAQIVGSLLPRTGPGARAQSRSAWALVALVKMIGLLAIAWLPMSYGLASPLGLLVGLCALPIGIAIGSLVGDRDDVSREP